MVDTVKENIDLKKKKQELIDENTKMKDILHDLETYKMKSIMLLKSQMYPIINKAIKNCSKIISKSLDIDAHLNIQIFNGNGEIKKLIQQCFDDAFTSIVENLDE